jgi:DNA-binding transcriptional LysR family regulator
LGQVIEAGEELNVMQGRPAGTLRINAARVSIAMVLQQKLAGFLHQHPHVQIELTNDEGFIDIVERGFDAGIRMGESVQQDMVAVPLGGPVTMAVVASPDYLKRMPAPKHPDDLKHHNCIRFRFAGTGAIYKWEFEVEGRAVEYEIQGSLTISDTLFSLDAALEGVGLAYTYEQLAKPHIQAKRLTRLLTKFSPTFPGFYLYYPSRHNQPTKLKALIDFVAKSRAR